MQHQTITSIVFLETSESFDAAEVTKLDQRTSTVTLQKENNIKDAIAASSGELELGFHPEIHQQSQEIPRQRLRGETTQKKNAAAVDTNTRSVRLEFLPGSTTAPP